jgi:hypothetical protein
MIDLARKHGPAVAARAMRAQAALRDRRKR